MYNETSPSTHSPRRWSKGRVVVISSLVSLLLLLALFVGQWFTLNSEGVTWDTKLTAEYNKCESRLSQYYTNGSNALQIANANQQAIRGIIQDAMTGKYGDANKLALPTNPIYQQIVVSYPNVGDVSRAYAESKNVLVGSFNDYIEERNVLYDMLAHYDQWRRGNPLNAMIIRAEGFPSDLLAAHDGNAISFGVQAEYQMWRVIADPNTMKSYQDGVLQPVVIPTPSK